MGDNIISRDPREIAYEFCRFINVQRWWILSDIDLLRKYAQMSGTFGDVFLKVYDIVYSSRVMIH